MIIKICPVCKKRFEVHNYRRNTANFCSYKCAWKNKEIRFHRICPICKKKFITKIKKQIFCSRKCFGKFRQTSVIKKCLYCKKEIFVKPVLINRKKYCSKKCQNLLQKQTMKGKHNPFYNKKHTDITKRRMSKILIKRWKEGWSPSFKRGKEHPQFKGIHTNQGYIYLHQPFHPMAKNEYVKRANLVMEKMIGRFLEPKEIVHHKGIKYPINSLKNRGDDGPINLQLFTNESKHKKFHYPYGFNPKRKQK